MLTVNVALIAIICTCWSRHKSFVVISSSKYPLKPSSIMWHSSSTTALSLDIEQSVIAALTREFAYDS